MNIWNLVKDSSARKYYDRIISIGKPNIVFIWIPKNGGTSVYQWLSDSVGMMKLKRSRRFYNFSGAGPVTFSHVHYLSLLKSGIVPQHYHDSAYKFCITRNPFDRAVSLYKYVCIREERFRGSLIDFLEEVRLRRPPIGLYNTLGISQSNPQVSWLLDENGGLLVNDTYKLEDMNELYKEISKKFALSVPTFQNWENRSDYTTTAQELLVSHNEVIPLIQHIYEQDFALLGYNQESPLV